MPAILPELPMCSEVMTEGEEHTDSGANACLLGCVLVGLAAVYFLMQSSLALRLISLPLAIGAWELLVQSWRLYAEGLDAERKDADSHA